MRQRLINLVKQNWCFALFLLLMFSARSSIADWYHVPSSSMFPTIEVGDRIFVNKMAYRVELPFSDIPVIQTGLPQRGDIVVFNSDAAKQRLVKRIIALPGDTISMRNNKLSINGKTVNYQRQANTTYLEQFPDTAHSVVFFNLPQQRSSFAELQVPEGHFFVMGDNRNNSLDSRFYGFVPASELQGKATHVIASFDKDNFYLPKSDRFFDTLN